MKAAAKDRRAAIRECRQLIARHGLKPVDLVDVLRQCAIEQCREIIARHGLASTDLAPPAPPLRPVAVVPPAPPVSPSPRPARGPSPVPAPEEAPRSQTQPIGPHVKITRGPSHSFDPRYQVDPATRVPDGFLAEWHTLRGRQG